MGKRNYGAYAAAKYSTCDVYGDGEYPVMSKCWNTWQIHLRDTPGRAWFLKANWDTNGCGLSCTGDASKHLQLRRLDIHAIAAEIQSFQEARREFNQLQAELQRATCKRVVSSAGSAKL